MDDIYYIMIISAMGTVCAVLIFKIILMRKSAGEIISSMREILKTETNILIGISSRDKKMRKLADEINRQLKTLRERRQKYNQGDLKLKTAVTNISHDLRTPLTAICGYIDLLEQEEKSENSIRYLKIVRERTEALRDLTEDLLRYSIVASDAENKIAEISLNAAVEENISAYYAALVERGITPKISLPEKSVMRKADRKSLSRVLSNIMSNVLKYSKGDLEISLSEDGTIVYSNSACGLDEITIGRLFDRFYTVESGAGSTGLGLSIAKTLTEDMGGEIHAVYEKERMVIIVRL